MTDLWRVFRLILREQPVALWRGAVLSLVVLLMGTALLGLSGWFITAAAAAGLAGLGAVFDVFRPSAMVRFLALGRAAARYGERLLTHDATLRALEVVRVRLLDGLIAAPYQRMIRIRGAQALNRLTADVDALDGVPLRLVLPVMAGVMTHLAAFVAIWALVGLAMGLWILLGYLIGAGLIFWHTGHRTARLSRRAEAAAQGFRSRLIDLIGARRDLAVHGRLVAQAKHVLAADDRRLILQLQQDRAERRAGAALQMLGTVVAGGALWLGISMVQSGNAGPPLAALGVFAALALAETVAPLRRAASDLGRMAEAARRVSRDIAPGPPLIEPVSTPDGGGLSIEGVTLHKPLAHSPVIRSLDLAVAPGETVALIGASGSGKSTLLLAIAALHPIAKGRIAVGGLAVPDWDEAGLREYDGLLPQRSVLMAGTVAETLRLGAPDRDDGTLWAALDAVALTPLFKSRDGLNSRIGARAEGLSGGEARRLALARVLIRRPNVLLLDEPTEGLDDATAEKVLADVRRFLPDSAILIAAHRDVETAFADRIVALK